MMERDRRFPAQHFPRTGVVAIASPDSLRTAEVVSLVDALARGACDHLHQLVNGDQFIGTQVQGLAVVRSHNPDESLDKVIHVQEGTSLLTIAPDLDLTYIMG